MSGCVTGGGVCVCVCTRVLLKTPKTQRAGRLPVSCVDTASAADTVSPHISKNSIFNYSDTIL